MTDTSEHAANRPFLESVAQDLRYALRGMRRNPGFTTIAVLSLGVGIGANTAIFSIVKGILLRPLAYHEPSRLVAIREAVVGAGHMSSPANPLHARAWRTQCPALEQLSLARLTAFSLVQGGEAEQIQGARVEPEVFTTLGVLPQLGRPIVAGDTEPGRDRVVVLADSLWRRRFGSDPALVGRAIDLSGVPYQVIGVLPAHFRFPFSGGMEAHGALPREPEIYRPLIVGPNELRPLTNFNYSAIARLKPGATLEGALAEINTVEAQFPRLAGQNVTLQASLIPLQGFLVGAVRTPLWLLMGAVGAVLVIVCFNLANLLIARITARTRDTAIRTALGATRGRQVRQLLTECLLLSAFGGAAGIAIAAAALALLIQAAPADLPRLDQVRLDSGVLAFAVALTVATGLLAGLLPSLMMRRDPQDALKAGSHTTTGGTTALRTRHMLIGLEVAVTTALLIVAGLLTVSFIRVIHVDKGFETARVIAADLSMMGPKYAKDGELDRFVERLLARLRGTPGIESAAVVSALPSRGETWIDPVSVEGDTRPVYEQPMPNNRWVTPEYFWTMGIAVRRGRTFAATDRDGDYGILSEKLAERLWPGDDPVGKRFLGSNGKTYTVAGVVADVRSELTKEPAMIVYYPYWSNPHTTVSLVARTTPHPATLASAVRTVVREEDYTVPIRAIRTLDDVVGAAMEQRRFQLVVVLTFAASALLVASLGIYGVVAFSVVSRHTEMGVRMALGARPVDLFMLIVRQGMTPVALGLAGGLAIALSVGNGIRSLLFGVEPGNLMTMAIVVMVLAATALLACLMPARAAASSDPVRTLRAE